jgi:hypothetical protein
MEPTTGTYAAIDNGVVVNFIVGYENCEHPYDEIVCIDNFDNGEYPIMMGSSYINGKFIPSEENLIELQKQEEKLIEKLWNNLRNSRNQKLKESDIIMFRHLENGEEVPQALKDYRQALRDLPQNIENIKDAIVWPTYP